MSNRIILWIIIAVFAIAANCTREGAQPDEVPKVNELAPDFILPALGDGTIRLSDFRDQKDLVLYFYPKDNSPLCSREAYEFVQNKSKFDSLGIEIIGISVDGMSSHEDFKKRFGINFTLLSDSTKAVCKRYGVLNQTGLANRTTFVVNKQGIITAVFENVQVDGHVQNVLAVFEN